LAGIALEFIGLGALEERIRRTEVNDNVHPVFKPILDSLTKSPSGDVDRVPGGGRPSGLTPCDRCGNADGTVSERDPWWFVWKKVCNKCHRDVLDYAYGDSMDWGSPA
jgi:hypothetical protein